MHSPRSYNAFEQHLRSLLRSPDPQPALQPLSVALDRYAACAGLSPAQHVALSFAASNHMEHYWAGDMHSMGVAALDEEVGAAGTGAGGVTGYTPEGTRTREPKATLAQTPAARLGRRQRLAYAACSLLPALLALSSPTHTPTPRARVPTQVLPGGDVVLPGGYSGLVGTLAAGLDVRLGHQVKHIRYGVGHNDGGGGGASGTGAGVAVTVHIASPQPLVPSEHPGHAQAAAGVAVDGGRLVTLHARAAVVTLPLGVLRSGGVAFSPPLGATDPAKAAAIGALGTAVYNKVCGRVGGGGRVGGVVYGHVRGLFIFGDAVCKCVDPSYQ